MIAQPGELGDCSARCRRRQDARLHLSKHPRLATPRFDVPGKVMLDEEIIGLGKYGYALTVLTSEALLGDPLDEEDEDSELERSWMPRFAYGR
jgi:hypothetical protein